MSQACVPAEWVLAPWLSPRPGGILLGLLPSPEALALLKVQSLSTPEVNAGSKCAYLYLFLGPLKFGTAKQMAWRIHLESSAASWPLRKLVSRSQKCPPQECHLQAIVPVLFSSPASSEGHPVPAWDQEQAIPVLCLNACLNSS